MIIGMRNEGWWLVDTNMVDVYGLNLSKQETQSIVEVQPGIGERARGCGSLSLVKMMVMRCKTTGDSDGMVKAWWRSVATITTTTTENTSIVIGQSLLMHPVSFAETDNNTVSCYLVMKKVKGYQNITCKTAESHIALLCHTPSPIIFPLP
jgi:hypothetical protein